MNPLLHALLGAKRSESEVTLFTRIVGDITTATMLAELVYWFAPDKAGKSRLRIHRHGKPWVAISREHWQSKCGITERKYRRCVAVLEDMELIERQRMRFRGMVYPHFWLDEEKLAKLVQATLENGAPVRSRCPNRFGQDVRTGSVNMSEPKSSTSYPSTSLATSYSGAPREKQAGDLPKSGQGKSNVLQFPKRETMANAKETLAKFKSRDHADVLRIKWVSEVAGVTGRFAPALTLKETKLLKDACAGIANTAHRANDVIEYAVRHWRRFAAQAKDDAGLLTTPDEPHVGFFYKHWTSAIKLIEEAAAPPKTPHAKKSVPKPAVVVSTKPADEEPPMTFEESLALLHKEQDKG